LDDDPFLPAIKSLRPLLGFKATLPLPQRQGQPRLLQALENELRKVCQIQLRNMRAPQAFLVLLLLLQVGIDRSRPQGRDARRLFPPLE